MVLFKWKIRLGSKEYNEVIADGYVYALNEEHAIEKVKEVYTNKYETVIIEDDWDFIGDEDLIHDNLRRIGDVIIRWEE